MKYMTNLAAEAFVRLYPNRIPEHTMRVEYSGRFRPYNANVKRLGRSLTFSLSREWKQVSDDIVIGLLQELLLKILHAKGKTTNTDLYNGFVRNLHLSAVHTETDALLETSFHDVNHAYFSGVLDVPNLRWGKESRRKLASYDYHTDTITVSALFRDAPAQLISYLLYHEMLHKQLKFSSTGNRSRHHSREFREREKLFKNQEQMEEELGRFLREKQRPHWLHSLTKLF
jgi:predicted metal-dependent hydrolase